MKKLIFIETDGRFIKNIENNLKKEGLQNDYSVINIMPDTDAKNVHTLVIQSCVNQVISINTEDDNIYGIFVDICIIDGESEPLGIEIARKLRNSFPQIPIYNITNKTKHDFEFDSLSLASLENIDGVLVKSFLEGDTFSKERFEHFFQKAHLKRSITSSEISDSQKKEKEFDIAIITSLDDPEFKAVKKIINNVKPINNDLYSIKDNTVYFEGEMKGKTNNLNVIAACDSRMGMPAISSLATRIINTFNPTYLIILGIAAGVEGKTNIGDLLVTEYSWDYGSGKIEDKDGKTVFRPYIHQLKLDENLRNKLFHYKSKTELLNKIREEYPNPEDSLLKIHIGPFASGAAVISNDKFVDELKEEHKKIIGFDMEVYGVYCAAESFPEGIKPKVIAIKGVSDFGNSNKGNLLKKPHQVYAAYTSCEFFKVFSQNEL